jgi:dipeptidyl aminopeptidase/acylaminoacyl peptidase
MNRAQRQAGTAHSDAQKVGQVAGALTTRRVLGVGPAVGLGGAPGAVARAVMIAAAGLCLLAASGAPLLAGVRPVTVQDLMRIRNIEDARLSPAGDRVAYVLSDLDLERNAVRTNIWLVPAAGGTPVRLTAGLGRDASPRWSPDGNLIAFLSDRDGGTQLWLISPDGGEASKAAVIEGGVSNFAWSPDGRKIAFLSMGPKPPAPEKLPRRADEVIVYDEDRPGPRLFILDIASKEVTALTPPPAAVVDFSWSPDARRIVFASQPSPRVPDMFKTDLFTVDLETRAISELVRREGIDTTPRWSPNGRKIAFLSTEGSTGWITNWYLCVVAAEGGMPLNLTPKLDEFLFSPQWSPDSQTVFFQSPSGFRNQVFAVPAAGGAARPLLGGDPVWSDFSFSERGDRMAFLGTDASTPSEVYVSSVRPFAPLRLTFTNSQLADLALGRRETVRWTSSDGLGIEGLLLLPPSYVEGKRVPLLTYVHGGPSARFEAGFSPQIGTPYPVQAECYPLHVFAGLGYAVFMPNVRGSYGYGERFRKANMRDWGGGDYRDIMSGIDALIKRGLADPSRLGIMGRSYGGYMTGWIITQTDRFKAASLGAGMSDLVSFYGQTDIPGYTEYYLGDVPWKALDLYLGRSPVAHAANLKTPTLILHGEKDFRVPVPQAEELYQALKKNGVPVEFLIYPRQGHVVVEPKFMADMMERNIEWFGRWIK